MNLHTRGLILSVNISYFDNKNKISFLYQKSSKLSSNKYIKSCYVNNVLHNDNGPAVIYYRINIARRNELSWLPCEALAKLSDTELDIKKIVREDYYICGKHIKHENPEIN